MSTDLPAYLHDRKARQNRTKAIIYGAIAVLFTLAAISALLEDPAGAVLPSLIALGFYRLANNRIEDHQHHKAAAGADPTPEP